MIPIVMYLPKNSYLVDPFNMRLLWFESAGLVKFWQSSYGDMKYLADPNDFTGPKSLKVSHLSATFQIWLCSSIAGVVIFIFELIFNETRVDFLRAKLGMKKREKKVVKKNEQQHILMPNGWPKAKMLIKAKSMRW
jgi:hypothetical protein